MSILRIRGVLCALGCLMAALAFLSTCSAEEDPAGEEPVASLDDTTSELPPATFHAGDGAYGPYDLPLGYSGLIDCLPCGTPWLHTEYLMWWTKGMFVPPLVTATTGDPSGVPPADGSLDEPETVILFGNEELFTKSRSGLSLRAGMWLDECCRTGIEGDYFFLNDDSTRFSATSNGTPVVSRPFYNMTQVAQDVELVAFPDVLAGTVFVEADTELQSAGVRLRHRLFCESGCTATSACDESRPYEQRLDFLIGYRFVKLDEALRIGEDLNSLIADEQFVIRESFAADNQFQGMEIGVLSGWEVGSASLEVLGKLALGHTREHVVINGSTATTQLGVAQPVEVGGLLAQTSNIGDYEQDSFAVIPELGVTFGYQFTPRLRGTVGYTFLYWSRVVRPGDQIDLDINENLLPPQTPPIAGPSRPAFSFVESDYWAQGVRLGLDFCW